MISIRFALATALVLLIGSAPGFAQDKPQDKSQDKPDTSQVFNAFSIAVANGTIVRSAEKEVMVVGTLAGPMFVETDEGPAPAGRITCAASVHVDGQSARMTGTGACTFTAEDGAMSWGNWECAGYQLVGCHGTLKLSGGTGRMAGVSGEGSMVWRPAARQLRTQLDGTALVNVDGIVIWRDFKISKTN